MINADIMYELESDLHPTVHKLFSFKRFTKFQITKLKEKRLDGRYTVNDPNAKESILFHIFK